jgi:fatty acid desaturase
MNFISNKDLKTLSKTNLWKSLGQILFEYILVALFITIGIYFSNFFVTLLMMMLIAARQHALGVIAHDASHYRFTKNKKLNDFISNIFVTFPTLTSLSNYRYIHMMHHTDTNTENDPDYMTKIGNPEYHFPQTKTVFLKNIGKHLFGIHFIYKFMDKKMTLKEKFRYLKKGFVPFRKLDNVDIKEIKKDKIHMMIFNIILISFLIYQGWFHFYLIYWVLPVVLYLACYLRIRGIVEHMGVEKKEIEASRTLYPKWWEVLFLGFSWNSTYHLDHHMYPSVPSYNLRKLHSLLLQNPEYKEKAQITPDGLYGLFKECTI